MVGRDNLTWCCAVSLRLCVAVPDLPCEVFEADFINVNRFRWSTPSAWIKFACCCSSVVCQFPCVQAGFVNFSGNLQIFKVARLQSEFCTKDFFRATNFLAKNAPKFSPKCLSLFLWVRKNPRKIPSEFPTKFSKFPCEKSKKFHRRASAGAQGEQIWARLRGRN